MLGITWLELVTCIEATPENSRVYKIAYSLPFSVYVEKICTLRMLTSSKYFTVRFST